MMDLRDRVRKLEKKLTDSTGLVPDSKQWIEYWFDNTDRLMAGDKTARRVPVEIFRIWAGITPVENLAPAIREVVRKRRRAREAARNRG